MLVSPPQQILLPYIVTGVCGSKWSPRSHFLTVHVVTSRFRCGWVGATCVSRTGGFLKGEALRHQRWHGQLWGQNDEGWDWHRGALGKATCDIGSPY